jgi:sec-independent protein translocase protein TatB
MFDIGFWEILLIGIVTLLVVGPQRLPGVAVFAGHWIGRIRRFVRNMRDEINEELETEHLKSLLAEQNREIDELRRDVQAVRGDTERTFKEAEDEVRAADPSAADSGALADGTDTGERREAPAWDDKAAAEGSDQASSVDGPAGAERADGEGADGRDGEKR